MLTKYATSGINAKHRFICGWQKRYLKLYPGNLAEGGGGGGGCKMSAKQVTTVRENVSTSVICQTTG